MGQKCQAIKDVHVLIQSTANPVERIKASAGLVSSHNLVNGFIGVGEFTVPGRNGENSPLAPRVIVRACDDFRYHGEQFGPESKTRDIRSSFLVDRE